MYHHVVTFELLREQDVQPTAQMLRNMAGRVPTLRHIEVGVDEGRTPRSVHLALITRFDNEAGYRAYAADPVHKGVLAHIGTVVKTAAVVDWSD